jgi:hypothetical protein
MVSASGQRNEFQETRLTDRCNDECFIEVANLGPVEHDDDAAAAHGVERDLDLGARIELATRPGLPVAVELQLNSRRAYEADETWRLGLRRAVVALDLEFDTGANDVTGRDFRDFERELRSPSGAGPRASRARCSSAPRFVLHMVRHVRFRCGK